MSASHPRRTLEILATDAPSSASSSTAPLDRHVHCARCNNETGRRHDVRYGRTARSVEVVNRLLVKCRARLPDAPPDLNPGYRRR